MRILILLSFSLAGAAPEASASAGSLGRVGEKLGEADLVEVTLHPEFERYLFRDGKGRTLVAELARADGEHEGLCTAQGWTLFPRPELVEGELAPVRLDPLCERLAHANLGERAMEPSPLDPNAAGPVPGGALTAAGALALVGWLLLARRALAPMFAVSLLALGVRLLLVEPGVFNGGGAAYEKLLIAFGEMRGHEFGPGYQVALRPFLRLWGETPSSVFAATLAYGAASAGALYWAALQLGPPRAALAAAAALALWPAHLAVSRSEAMHVPAVFFALIALGAAWRGGAGGALVAAAGALCAVAIRADMLAVLPVVAAFGLRSGRAGALWGALLTAALAGVALWRLGESADAGLSVLRPDSLLQLELWVQALTPHFEAGRARSAAQLFFTAQFTPAAWWALAALGAWCAPRGVKLAVAVWIVFGTLPFLAKVFPLADLVRLQLFAGAGWIVLVGLGAAHAGRWGALLLLVGAVPNLVRPQPGWVSHTEWLALSRLVPTLDARERVVSHAYGHRGPAFRAVMGKLGPARWADSGQATLLYRTPGEPPPGGTPFAVVELAPVADLDVALPPGPVTVGFYRVATP